MIGNTVNVAGGYEWGVVQNPAFLGYTRRAASAGL